MPNNQAGDRLSSPCRAAVVAAIALSMGIADAGADARVTITNDPTIGNSRPDDRYTAETRFDIETGARRVTFGERMFTDRVSRYRFRRDVSQRSNGAAPARVGASFDSPSVRCARDEDYSVSACRTKSTG